MGINVLCYAACGMAEQILLYFRGNARLFQPCGIGMAQNMGGYVKPEREGNASQSRADVIISKGKHALFRSVRFGDQC